MHRDPGEIGLNLHRAVVAQTVELGRFSFHFQSSFLSSNWYVCIAVTWLCGHLLLTMVFPIAFILFSERLCWFPLFMIQKRERGRLEVSKAF